METWHTFAGACVLCFEHTLWMWVPKVSLTCLSCGQVTVWSVECLHRKQLVVIYWDNFFCFRVQLLKRYICTNLCFLTPVVIVINGGVHFCSVVRIRAISLVVLLVVCIIIYPLHTSHCPLNHLAFRWLVSQQKKWKIRRKDDRNVFISVCSTTEVNLCEFPVIAIRKRSITFIVTIAVFPEHPSRSQIFRAGIVSFINTVFPCNKCKIPFRK